MDLQKFNRKPFIVEGVLVTEENLQEVAAWVGGEVRVSSRNNESYVKVPVINPLSNRHTLAFVGDWVLRSNVPKPNGEQKSFKVYTEKSLRRNFVEYGELVYTTGVHYGDKAVDAPEYLKQ